MAPDRGDGPDYQSISSPSSSHDNDFPSDAIERQQRSRSEARRFIANHASEGQNFTARGILVGLGVGLIICFSNMVSLFP